MEKAFDTIEKLTFSNLSLHDEVTMTVQVFEETDPISMNRGVR